MARTTTKKGYTVKKTGYILKTENAKLVLDEVRLARDTVRDNLCFIQPTVQKLINEVGITDAQDCKKVRVTVTVTYEEL